MYKLLNSEGAIIALGTMADILQCQKTYSYNKKKGVFTVIGPIESTDAKMGYGAWVPGQGY